MRSLKTAVKILKNEIEMRLTRFGISPEDRTAHRKSRQATIREIRSRMIQDLLNRNRIGDIKMERDDLEELVRQEKNPVLTTIIKIYQRYI